MVKINSSYVSEVVYSYDMIVYTRNDDAFFVVSAWGSKMISTVIYKHHLHCTTLYFYLVLILLHTVALYVIISVHVSV